MQNAKVKMVSKVDDLTQKGKKLVDENGKEGIQLRGEFSKKKERIFKIFKQARYKVSRNRQMHYHMHN